MQTSRVKWIDTLRFLAISAVLLGHYTQAAGRFYTLVFIYHVPLFFFISGFFARSSAFHTDDQRSFLSGARLLVSRTKKNARRILLPYYFFVFSSILLVFLVSNGASIRIVKEWIISALFGIRNTLVNGGSWFFPCLFSVMLLHDLLSLFLKKRCLVTLCCIVLFIIEEHAFTPNLINNPSMIYNVDSALYYMLFYDLGELVFPHIHRLLAIGESRTFQAKLIKSSVIVVLSVSSAYIGYVCFYDGYIRFSFPYSSLPIVSNILSLVVIFAFFWINIIAANLLQNVSVFNEIGQNTMYICGNEHIVKLLFTQTLLIFNITEHFTNPLSCLIHMSLMMYLNLKFLIPIEKRILRSS